MTEHKQTIFPTDSVTASARLFWYLMSRRQLFGASLLRWIVTALVLLGTFYFLGDFPGRWVGAALAALAALYVLFTSWRWQKQDFVQFVEQAKQAVDIDGRIYAPLDAQEKLPIHATGRFEVDGKQKRFTWISGYYRTFATREHAIMCLVQADQFDRVAFWAKFGQWNSDLQGMWYAFISPDSIDQIRIGELNFGHEPQPAVAIDYKVLLPAANYIQRILIGDRTIIETLYLACGSEEICARIFADLKAEL